MKKGRGREEEFYILVSYLSPSVLAFIKLKTASKIEEILSIYTAYYL